MAQCIVCKSWMPPGFTKSTPDGLARKCLFCEQEKDNISIDNKNVNKQWVVDEYKKYLNEQKDKPNVKKLIFPDEE